MKPYRITLTPAHGPAHSYCGLYAHSVDAILHALDLAQGQPMRISAKVIA